MFFHYQRRWQAFQVLTPIEQEQVTGGYLLGKLIKTDTRNMIGSLLAFRK